MFTFLLLVFFIPYYVYAETCNIDKISINSSQDLFQDITKRSKFRMKSPNSNFFRRIKSGMSNRIKTTRLVKPYKNNIMIDELIKTIRYAMEDLGDEDILNYIDEHELTAETSFDESGLNFDEMCAIELMTAISQDLRIEIKDDVEFMDILLYGTIGEAADYLKEC